MARVLATLEAARRGGRPREARHVKPSPRPAQARRAFRGKLIPEHLPSRKRPRARSRDLLMPGSLADRSDPTLPPAAASLATVLAVLDPGAPRPPRRSPSGPGRGCRSWRSLPASGPPRARASRVRPPAGPRSLRLLRGAARPVPRRAHAVGARLPGSPGRPGFVARSEPSPASVARAAAPGDGRRDPAPPASPGFLAARFAGAPEGTSSSSVAGP